MHYDLVIRQVCLASDLIIFLRFFKFYLTFKKESAGQKSVEYFYKCVHFSRFTFSISFANRKSRLRCMCVVHTTEEVIKLSKWFISLSCFIGNYSLYL